MELFLSFNQNLELFPCLFLIKVIDLVKSAYVLYESSLIKKKMLVFCHMQFKDWVIVVITL